MGVSSSQLQPQELITFKKLPTDVPLDNIEIPERPENRNPTNVKWLIVFGVFVGVLLPLLIYTLYYSEVKRQINGYDKCGNICGQSNYHWADIDCSGKDMADKPYLQYDNHYIGERNLDEVEFRERRCVQDCSNITFPLLGRCLLLGHNLYTLGSNDGEGVQLVKFDQESIDFGLYFESVKWQITISCLLSVLVSIGMVFLFRYAVVFVVWGIPVGCFWGIVILDIFFWYVYLVFPNIHDGRDRKQSLFVVAITFAIFAIILGLVFIWCMRRIRLVIVLLKEATKAVFDIPGIMLVPLVSVILVFILTVIFFLITFAGLSGGSLQHAYSDYYIYETNSVIIFTLAYTFVVYLWTCQILIGVQYMIIAGAVSKWYFSRDKTFLGSPIMTSLSNAFRFHLGTVAMGSLIIAIVQVIRAIILGLIDNVKIRLLVKSCCIEAIETFFRFLSKNAYIITAMHGQSFIKSGKRAAKLIMQNISDIIAINYIGDFVLGMAKILIVVITLLLSMGIFAFAPSSVNGSNFYGYIVIALVSTLVACVTLGVFETSIDTLFVCYCEDNVLNDGMARPYFMSRNLMEFVQSSKAAYQKT